MQRQCGNKAVFRRIQRVGTVKAHLRPVLQATSCVARDDRDGLSRYRESKISRKG